MNKTGTGDGKPTDLPGTDASRKVIDAKIPAETITTAQIIANLKKRRDIVHLLVAYETEEGGFGFKLSRDAGADVGLWLLEMSKIYLLTPATSGALRWYNGEDVQP